MDKTLIWKTCRVYNLLWVPIPSFHWIVNVIHEFGYFPIVASPIFVIVILAPLYYLFSNEIRYSGIRMNENMPYLYGRRHWIYTFIYLDGSGLLEFECDYDNNIKRYVRKCDTE